MQVLGILSKDQDAILHQKSEQQACQHLDFPLVVDGGHVNMWSFCGGFALPPLVHLMIRREKPWVKHFSLISRAALIKKRESTSSVVALLAADSQRLQASRLSQIPADLSEHLSFSSNLIDTEHSENAQSGP